jgi:hypothetical protein
MATKMLLLYPLIKIAAFILACYLFSWGVENFLTWKKTQKKLRLIKSVSFFAISLYAFVILLILFLGVFNRFQMF